MVKTVADEDWYGRELLAESFEGVLFDGVDFTEMTSRGTTFTACTFRRCRFNVSAHTATAFANCTFASCNFFDARFDGCKLTGSTFIRCEFALLRVDQGDWRFVSLRAADLTSSRFTAVRFGEADLSLVRGAGSILRDCDLAGADVSDADLSGADLRGSDLVSIDPRRARLTGAVVGPEQALVVAMNLGLDVRFEEEGA